MYSKRQQIVSFLFSYFSQKHKVHQGDAWKFKSFVPLCEKKLPPKTTKSGLPMYYAAGLA